MDINELKKQIGGKFQSRADRTKLESPIEKDFIEKLEKYLSIESEVISQYDIATQAGNFRLDFVIKRGSKNIGIECDGKEFHDEWRDEWRDGLILDTGKIDVIYRFRGTDIFRLLNDCIYFVFHLDQEIFNERYKHLYPNLISNELNEYAINGISKTTESHLILYSSQNDRAITENIQCLKMFRRTLRNMYHWRSVLRNYVLKNPELTIDQLIELRKQDMSDINIR